MPIPFDPRAIRRLLLAPLLILAGLTAATPALAVMLVELKIDATARPYHPDDPPSSAQQDFSVPDGEGQLIMTYTEDRYVGGPGGFSLDPVDLSNEYLGWGGSAAYTPHDPVAGQPYKVEVIWNNSFSKKMWRATLTAHHAYQAFQVRDRGQQLASTQTLTVEFIPKSLEPIAAPQSSTLDGSWEWPGANMVEILADGTGRDSRGNSMQWKLLDAARGIYELSWSHGFTDTVTLAPDGKSVTGVNNTGFHFSAVRRGPPPTAATQPGDSSLAGSWDWGPGSGSVDILADGTGHDSLGNTLTWTLLDEETQTYKLKWSHGFIDIAVVAADGASIGITSNSGARFGATRR